VNDLLLNLKRPDIGNSAGL